MNFLKLICSWLNIKGGPIFTTKHDENVSIQRPATNSNAHSLIISLLSSGCFFYKIFRKLKQNGKAPSGPEKPVVLKENIF